MMQKFVLLRELNMHLIRPTRAIHHATEVFIQDCLILGSCNIFAHFLFHYIDVRSISHKTCTFVVYLKSENIEKINITLRNLLLSRLQIERRFLKIIYMLAKAIIEVGKAACILKLWN